MLRRAPWISAASTILVLAVVAGTMRWYSLTYAQHYTGPWRLAHIYAIGGAGLIGGFAGALRRRHGVPLWVSIGGALVILAVGVAWPVLRYGLVK